MIYVGIIPARAGSKGVPGKNKKILNGKPLIAYTIESALAAKVLDIICVSSDDKDILEIASGYEGVVCLVRPQEIAQDESSTEQSLVNALEQLGLSERAEDVAVVTLEPTSPFRTCATMKLAISMFEKNGFAKSVVSVVEDYGVYYKSDIKDLYPIFHNLPRRRQDREPLLQEKSMIYVTPAVDLLNNSLVLGRNGTPLIVDSEEAFDINTMSDFAFAEFKMKTK
jgi:CMP-N,N'-diacetyllegionaminic acid synthase